MDALQVGDLIRIAESHYGLKTDEGTLIVIATEGESGTSIGSLQDGELAARYIGTHKHWGVSVLVVNKQKIVRL